MSLPVHSVDCKNSGQEIHSAHYEDPQQRRLLAHAKYEKDLWRCTGAKTVIFSFCC